MLAIDDKAGLSTVVKLLGRLKLHFVMAGGAVAQEAKDRAALAIIAVEIPMAGLALAVQAGKVEVLGGGRAAA